MNRKLRSELLLVSMLLLTFATFGQSTKNAAKPASSNPFKSLIDRYYAAWNSGNPDNAAPLYAQGCRSGLLWEMAARLGARGGYVQPV